jgi:hypothetical protein
MRGELDDALARMARMQEVQRRRSAESVGDGRAANPNRSPVDELVDAVRWVVAQHRSLGVTFWAEDGGSTTAVRVEWADGTVSVTYGEDATGSPQPPTVPTVPLEVVADAPVTPAAPVAPVAVTAPSGPPPAWPMAVRTPPAWAAAPESNTNESAARLAALIREDPSLLRVDEEP